MNEITVPPSGKWFQSGLTCTPDNGFLYATTFSLVYLPPSKAVNDNLKIKVINTVGRVKHSDCSLDWSTNKYVAYMNDKDNLIVHDINEPKKARGHSCHEIKSGLSEFGSFCFTKSNRIYSVNEKMFVDYCFVSNTHKIDPTFMRPYRNGVTLLKSAPHNPSVLACGTKTGLILIVDAEEKMVLFQLRGHDLAITSMEWLIYDESSTNTKKIKTPVKNAASINDVVVEDIFDIYSTEGLEEEFGTIRDNVTSLIDNEENNFGKDIAKSNENFNFVEECNNLRDMIKSNNDNVVVEESISPDAKDFVIVESNPSDDDFFSDQSEAKCGADDKLIYLATGARDTMIWVWDIDNGIAVDKIVMVSNKNSPLPSK